jgi:hypothetical protein
MGVVLMSKRELNRIDVLARLDAGRLTTLAAADLMRIIGEHIGGLVHPAALLARCRPRRRPSRTRARHRR